MYEFFQGWGPQVKRRSTDSKGRSPSQLKIASANLSFVLFRNISQTSSFIILVELFNCKATGWAKAAINQYGAAFCSDGSELC